MKKIIPFIVLLVLLLALTFFNKKDTRSVPAKNKEDRAVFLSYIELKNYLYNKDINTSKSNIKKIIKNLKAKKYNILILQVRTFSDAIYNSKLFPTSKVVVANEGDNIPYDYLDFFIKEAHLEKIKVHAWINPYRISTNTNTNSISIKNPAFKWLGTNNIEITSKGIYYNPASSEVTDLIVKGVEEIITNYNVDGICFDDYFYPSKTIDLVSYEESNTKETIYEYRLNNVSNMVKRVYDTVHKSKNKDIVFGISPDGNIENNYQKNYADVKVWTENKGYIDYIMPQIYYGFYNETKPYYKVINEWNKMIKADIDLYIALALYKSGTLDTYAKSGSNEWLENNDILKRQITLARNLSNYKGFSVFRYDNLFSSKIQTENTMQEIKNIEEIVK